MSATANSRAEPPLRAALAGCGRLGAGFYLPALAAAEGIELVALAEPDTTRRLEASWRAARLGARGVRVGADPEAMVASGLAEMLIVAGPPSTHFELARIAAAHGLRALVEKPPGRDRAEAAALAALEPAPMIAFNRRFQYSPSLWASAPLGGTIELELAYRRASWGAHSPSGDALEDLGTHLIDLAALALGPVRAVRCEALGESGATLELELERGRARISCSLAGRWREAVRVLDPAGKPVAMVSLGGARGRFADRLRRRPGPLLRSLIAQLEASATQVRSGSPSGDLRARPASAGEGLAVMTVVEAARQSAAADGAAVILNGPSRAVGELRPRTLGPAG